jgi:hypothetical protein
MRRKLKRNGVKNPKNKQNKIEQNKIEQNTTRSISRTYTSLSKSGRRGCGLDKDGMKSRGRRGRSY